MKKILIGLLALSSISAFGKTCEVQPVLNEDASKIILYMEDKVAAVEDAEEDEELMIAIYGGNPKNLDCEELIKEIKKSGKKTADIEGEKIPLQIIHTFNL
jgi:organic radical activating enzyme